MGLPRSGISSVPDSNENPVSTLEAKTEAKETTSRMMGLLKPPIQTISLGSRLQGAGLNPHIMSDKGFGQLVRAHFNKNGIAGIANTYFAKAVKEGSGVAQTWLSIFPILFIADPSLLQQLIFNKPNLVDGEKVGIQKKFFGSDSIIPLPMTDPRYAPFRELMMHRLFLSIKELAKGMQDSLSFYMKEIADAASANQTINIEDLSGRIAISLLSQTQLGFNNFPEKYKSRFAKIIHDIVTSATSPMNLALISLENLVETSVGKKVNLARRLNALAKAGEKILETVIDFNETDALSHLKEIAKDENLQAEDLIKAKIMSLIKLFLVGGFETTSKSIMFALSMLADPKNAVFVKKLREELQKKNAEKPVEQWTSEDVKNLELLHAFIFEVLRLFPPFSYMRHSSKTPFKLSQNIGIVKTKAEYLQKFNDPNRDTTHDIDVPVNMTIITSVYDAHRHPDLHGKDAGTFNPDRWLGKKLDLRSIQTRFDIFTFGNDRRVCPGRLVAEQELLFFIARVLVNFDVKLNLNLPLPQEVGFTLELARGTKPMATFTPLPKLGNKKDATVAETLDVRSTPRL